MLSIFRWRRPLERLAIIETLHVYLNHCQRGVLQTNRRDPCVEFLGKISPLGIQICQKHGVIHREKQFDGKSRNCKALHGIQTRLKPSEATKIYSPWHDFDRTHLHHTRNGWDHFVKGLWTPRGSHVMGIVLVVVVVFELEFSNDSHKAVSRQRR